MVFPSYRRMVHVGSVALALVLLVVLVADHAWVRAVITALATVVAVIAFGRRTSACIWGALTSH